tara:strand:+ start:58 stop:267 length:210 start_codon:yes stop_codon:yes gene_type:complete
MASPKFKIDDQVNKKKNTGVYLSIEAAVGTIIEVLEKRNRRGTPCFYYGVKWPDGRRSEHAQHILVPAP